MLHLCLHTDVLQPAFSSSSVSLIRSETISWLIYQKINQQLFQQSIDCSSNLSN